MDNTGVVHVSRLHETKGEFPFVCKTKEQKNGEVIERTFVSSGKEWKEVFGTFDACNFNSRSGRHWGTDKIDFCIRSSSIDKKTGELNVPSRIVHINNLVLKLLNHFPRGTVLQFKHGNEQACFSRFHTFPDYTTRDSDYKYYLSFTSHPKDEYVIEYPW